MYPMTCTGVPSILPQVASGHLGKVLRVPESSESQSHSLTIVLASSTPETIPGLGACAAWVQPPMPGLADQKGWWL